MRGMCRGVEGFGDLNVCTLVVLDENAEKDQRQEEIRSIPFEDKDPMGVPTLGVEHEAMFIRTLRGSRDILARIPKKEKKQTSSGKK
ncbi:hypothetical protein LIER_21680 [Lithospermum erythrorhizon]|uniref:Uncharacterized protein n=1 Tax=Lithospermum erythrorhizon TaxID=34254 RepID=A0AAV3QUJ3_LITER